MDIVEISALILFFILIFVQLSYLTLLKIRRELSHVAYTNDELARTIREHM